MSVHASDGINSDVGMSHLPSPPFKGGREGPPSIINHQSMIRVLITGAGSYVGESVKKYIMSTSTEFEIESVDTMNDAWKQADFSKYDVVYHVAGIAHVNADPKMEALYYKVNRDLTVEIAKHAQECGVKQFIFMSSQIVFHESQSLKTEVLTKETKENPNGFYGDSKLQAEKGLWELVAHKGPSQPPLKGGAEDSIAFQADGNTHPPLRGTEGGDMKICILRPCMIYGPNAKGNFPRLAKLATKVPVFPAWHNQRSMLYIDNLAEFVKQAILRQLEGTFYPQNRELADTVEIIRYFAKAAGHKVWITRLLNPFVWLGSFVLQPINKMFATYYYDPEMSKMDFDYQLVSFEESLGKCIIRNSDVDVDVNG